MAHDVLTTKPEAATEAEAGAGAGAALQFLQRHYQRFSFFQLCAAIEALSEHQQCRVQFWFKSNPQLVATARDVENLEIRVHANLWHCEMMVNFLGMVGATSPLPLHYTERLLLDDSDDNALQEFYDFFQHRLIELRYRLWRKYQYLHNYQANGQDRLSQCLISLCGLSQLPEFLQALPLQSLYPFLAYWMGGRPSKRQAMEIIKHYCQAEAVWLEENLPRSAEVPAQQQLRLQQQACVLGQTTVLGRTITDRQYHCAIHLEVKDPYALLPNQAFFQTVQALVQCLLQAPLTFTLQLHTQCLTQPVLNPSNKLYLGWTTRLGGSQSNEKVQIGLSESLLAFETSLARGG